ncbi:excisionase family DNA-binding protein [Pelagicoccus enzymogenes]|uniref:excisionase family DNA-binding protein n=1 Tax=Pelagicoccus enzymogenes TaxID=2773457 RepID=UPI003CE5160A
MSVREGARYIGVSERTMRALIADGEVPDIRVGRRVLLRRIDLDDFMCGRLK